MVTSRDEMLGNQMSPGARARALGLHLMWSLPEQGMDPEKVRKAFIAEGLPTELLEGIALATPASAYTIAMKYAGTTYTDSTGTRCRMTKNHLKTGGSGQDDKFWSSYALNVAAAEDARENSLRQAAIIFLNKETGAVELEFSIPAGGVADPRDIEAAERVYGIVVGKVRAWADTYSRESLNSFLISLATRFFGFYWVVRGNSWFIPNPDFGADLLVLPESNPIEVVLKVARVFRSMNKENAIDPVPLFPDPEGILSRSLTAREQARKSLEEDLQSQLPLLKALLQRDQRVKGANLAKRREAFMTLASKTGLYIDILGAEMADIQQQLQLAHRLMDEREASDLGLRDEALEGLW